MKVRLAIAGGLLVLSCKASTAAENRPEKGVLETSRANAKPDTGKKHKPGTSVSVDDELHEIEAVRGLIAKRRVEGRLISGTDLASHLEGVFSENLPGKAERGTEDALRLLGLVPLDFDYARDVGLLLRVGLAGLYEPREKLMFLREELSPLARRYTLLHELTHSLQDQYFDLSPFIGFHPGASDRIAALSATVEGDAMLTMMEAALAPEGRHVRDLSEAEILAGPPGGAEMADPDVLKELEKRPPPRFLLRSLAAPYQSGVHFMLRELQRGGFRALDGILANPPATTEQILHPEKYASHEAPHDVTIPDPLVRLLRERGFEVLLDEPLGELGMRTMFEEWAKPEDAARAAAGWDGDRFVSYGSDVESLVVGVLAFDSEADAEEAGALFAAKYLGKDLVPAKCSTNPDGSHLVARRGTSLLVALGPLERAQDGTFRLARALPFECNLLSGWSETH